MTIRLINFPAKKLPVKVPSIVTILSYSSLHWTLSLLSRICDKVKFKLRILLKSLPRSVTDTNQTIGTTFEESVTRSRSGVRAQYCDTVVTSCTVKILECSSQQNGVNQPDNATPTPSDSFQELTKFLGLRSSMFIQTQSRE